ncbi:hypothetical protein BpHYR1_053687 [Brachionus plicatilis]|uniref:Uncharacterized protein n=1 Tax=Brachionus plicatilis TaxID=10195 RepID=A0A3M7SGI0_BRAPC|nr:hypothetical protein BpHYR1_053687 [Brachionus plicatilis]
MSRNNSLELIRFGINLVVLILINSEKFNPNIETDFKIKMMSFSSISVFKIHSGENEFQLKTKIKIKEQINIAFMKNYEKIMFLSKEQATNILEVQLEKL